MSGRDPHEHGGIMRTTTTSDTSTLALGAGTAWGRALGMTAVLWLVLGLGCFGFGASYVHDNAGVDVQAAFLLDIVFVAGFLVVTAITLVWHRRTGGTLADLGWRRPTTTSALVVGVVFGVLWAALTFARGGDPLAMPWQRWPMILAGPVLAFGEEVARAFMLHNLHRARVPVWLQIVFGGVAMGSYHGFVGGHYTITYAISSFIMFALLSALYVWGRRSLTPVLVGHALPHMLADPVLTQGILHGVRAMGG